ncbi:MAG: DUF5680 domain-containing protein [Chloroflexota bacterium]
MNEQNLVSFLVEAKARTYAAQDDDASVAPLLNGSRQLEYQLGDFHYRDIYFGFRSFVGQEVVEFHGRPVWSMAYAGGVTDAALSEDQVRDVYRILRKALSMVAPSHVYRGPAHVEIDGYSYRNMAAGGLADFSGREEIRYDQRVVYALNYCGGLIR